MPALVGDRYEIVRELDRGGMGEVLLARQLNLGRLVVIKRVLAEHANEFVTALREEALLAARLNHPNIVGVLDVSEPDETAFVAMEYVAGVSVREMIKVAPTGLPVDVAITIAIDVLRGLAYAHEVRNGPHVGLVHRDIKPRNLMVTFAGVTKLIDFGISRWLRLDGQWDVTSVAGTYGYMSPEQLLKKQVDGRADQFALGITLREMLTGAPPDDGEATAGRVKPPRGTIEPELAAMVDRACAEQADARYATCEELAELLAAYARVHDLNPSAMCVEKWLEKNLADRIASSETDAQDANEQSVRPEIDPAPTTNQRRRSVRKPTAETVAERSVQTVAEGERVESARPPPTPPRSRRGVWIALGIAGAIGGGIALVFALRPPPPGELVAPAVPLTITIAASGSDEGLQVAITNIVARTLRDAPDRRFWLVRSGGKRIDVRFETTTAGVHLHAYDGDVKLASADGASVYQAADALNVPLAAALGKGREDPGPDAKEGERMRKLGARSYEQFRRYRKLAEEIRVPGWFDGADAIARFETMIAEDPAWGYPYAELNWLHGRSTPKAKQVLSDANAKVDPTRGSGLPLIRALDIELGRDEDAARRAIALAEPVFHADPEDLLAGEVLSSAYSIGGRDDEAHAITRRLYELDSSLFYAGDVVDDLLKSGRESDAQETIATTMRRHPESLTGARAQIKLEAQRYDGGTPNKQSPISLATRVVLIHGEGPIALAEIYEVMMAVGNLPAAQRIADRMLVGSPLSQTRGRYRTAVIAVFEGRFAAAYQLAKRAWEEAQKFGTEGEIHQTFQLLVSLGPIIGETQTTIELLEGGAVFADKTGHSKHRASLLYAAALLQRGATCPSPEAFLGTLTGGARDDTRRMLRRAAAQVGCAKCDQVVTDGFKGTETSAESLLAFGRCARVSGQPAIAQRAFERAASMWSSWNNAEASPVHAILAWYELGVTHSARKQMGLEAFRRFLRAWGRADRAIPEVADAERAISH